MQDSLEGGGKDCSVRRPWKKNFYDFLCIGKIKKRRLS